jgi:predicted nucleic acid-binding protein
MIVIVDANVIISGIIKPFGTIPKILLQKNNAIDFVLPEYALGEIVAHQKKICKAAGISSEELSALLTGLLVNVLLYSTESIDNKTLKQAENIARPVDVNDTVYVAFSIAFGAMLWTGDLKLYRSLRRNGFMNIITTKELSEIIKGLR